MIPGLGGMHWLMSFVGSIGVLMESSVLVPWLVCAFAGILKMLTGRKFPMNVRALRFTVLELLKCFVDNVTSFGELQEKLESKSQENILAEHSVNLTSVPDDVVYSCRERRKISLTHLSLSKNAPIFLCRRTYELCKIWALLSND